MDSTGKILICIPIYDVSLGFNNDKNNRRMCLKTCHIERGDVHCHTQIDFSRQSVNHSYPYVHGEQEDY